MEYRIDVFYKGDKETFAWNVRVYHNDRKVADDITLTRWGAFSKGKYLAKKHAKASRATPKTQKRKEYSKRYVV